MLSLTSEFTLDKLLTTDMTLLVKEIMNAREKKEYLDLHRYKIYQGKDGRWYTRLPKSDGGSIQKAFRTKEDLINFVVNYYKEETDSPTVSDVFNEAVDRRFDEGSISPPTKKRHEYDFIKYYSELGMKKVRDLKPDDIEEFLRTSKIRFDLNQKGYARLLTITRLIFKYAKRKKLIDFRIEDVIDDMDWGKNAFRKEELNDLDEVFSDEEVEKLVTYLKENQNGKHLGLLLCLVTGLRVGELSALKWEDISEDGIIVRRTERCWSGDDGKYHCEVINLPKTQAGKRIVPIPKQALWIIDEMRRENPDGEWAFMYKGNRTRTVYFRKAMAKACDGAGIKRRSPHKLRKTYASILLDNNLSVKTITENMGHTDIKVTNDRYARRRRTNEERSRIVSSIPEFDVVAAVAKEKR